MNQSLNTTVRALQHTSCRKKSTLFIWTQAIILHPICSSTCSFRLQPTVHMVSHLFNKILRLICGQWHDWTASYTCCPTLQWNYIHCLPTVHNVTDFESFSHNFSFLAYSWWVLVYPIAKSSLKLLLFTGQVNNVFIAYEWLMMVSAIFIWPGVARETKVLLVIWITKLKNVKMYVLFISLGSDHGIRGLMQDNEVEVGPFWPPHHW